MCNRKIFQSMNFTSKKFAMYRKSKQHQIVPSVVGQLIWEMVGKKTRVLARGVVRNWKVWVQMFTWMPKVRFRVDLLVQILCINMRILKTRGCNCTYCTLDNNSPVSHAKKLQIVTKECWEWVTREHSPLSFIWSFLTKIILDWTMEKREYLL